MLPLTHSRSNGMMAHPMIVVAPPLLELLDRRQLRGVVAHELAHLLHHDASAAAGPGDPGIGGVAGHGHRPRRLRPGPGPPRPSRPAGRPDRAVPGRRLVPDVAGAHLRQPARGPGQERAADARTVLLTGDPAGCADGISQLTAMLGNPERWTFGERLLPRPIRPRRRACSGWRIWLSPGFPACARAGGPSLHRAFRRTSRRRGRPPRDRQRPGTAVKAGGAGARPRRRHAGGRGVVPDR